MKSCIIFLAFILVAVACHRETGIYIPKEVDQQPYFPLDEQHFVEYQIDSLVFDIGPGGIHVTDSISNFVKEVVGDTFRDATGLLYHRIERYKRDNDTQPWQFDRNWAAAITPTQAIRLEDNLRFLRMIFPMDRRSEWNGNLWINSEYAVQIGGDDIRPFVNWTYEVDSIDIERQIGQFTFDSTLVITEVDESNIIERRYSKAIYAKHIGLVWKEQWILDSQYCNQTPPPFDCETKPWIEKVEHGYLYRQKVIGY